MLGQHQCSACGAVPAAVKVTKLVKKRAEETWLCQSCAAAQSPFQKQHSGLSIHAVLAGLLKQQMGEAAAKPGAHVDATCPSCGLPFDSYRKTLLLGCSECYESFDKHLVPDLRRFHGDTVHRGRVPAAEAGPIEMRRNPAELKRRLQDAVGAEDFELAAKLRDEIRRLTAPDSPN